MILMRDVMIRRDGEARERSNQKRKLGKVSRGRSGWLTSPSTGVHRTQSLAVRALVDRFNQKHETARDIEVAAVQEAYEAKTR